jgi:Protein of unknown function (DUF2892)
MQCNIDGKGKTARLALGAALALCGGGLLSLRWLDILSGGWPWYVGGLLVAAGLFSIFEGAAGWCAVRAMGFKTRL